MRRAHGDVWRVLRRQQRQERQASTPRPPPDECFWCDRPLPAGQRTIDHLVPRHLGGADDASNRRPCCLACNNERSQVSGSHAAYSHLLRYLAREDRPARRDRACRRWLARAEVVIILAAKYERLIRVKVASSDIRRAMIEELNDLQVMMAEVRLVVAMGENAGVAVRSAGR